MGHEGPYGEYRYVCTISLTSALDGGGGGGRGGWAQGPVWTGAENHDRTGIRFADRPTRSDLLYRLSYPGPGTFKNNCGDCI
jgi:hypothetical protein